MTEQKPIPTLSEAFAANIQSPEQVEAERERILAERAALNKPGTIPIGFAEWALQQRVRALPSDDPRARLYMSKHINREELSADDYAFIFSANPLV